MIIPVRCFTCGKPISHLWEDFKKGLKDNKDVKKLLDELGLKRYCCRALFMGQIDLIDIIGKYKRV